MLIDFDHPNRALFDKFDWWGLLALAGFLGGLGYVLEKDPGNDWLQDENVAVLAVIMMLGGITAF